MTHPCCFDGICDFDKKFFILRGVFASHKDLDGISAALNLVEIFGWPRLLARKLIKYEDGAELANLFSE